MHFYPYHMVFFWVFIPRTRFWSAFILVVYALKIVFLGPLLIFGCLYFLILLICFQGWSSILFKRYHLSQPSNRRWSPVQKTHSFPIPNGQPRSLTRSRASPPCSAQTCFYFGCLSFFFVWSFVYILVICPREYVFIYNVR